MKLIIISGHSTVANTEVITAVSISPDFECDIEYSDLTLDEKRTYDEGFEVIGLDCLVTINNTPYELDLQRMTSTVLNTLPDEMTIGIKDYAVLSATDKTKLDSFNQLLIDKCW